MKNYTNPTWFMIFNVLKVILSSKSSVKKICSTPFSAVAHIAHHMDETVERTYR